MIVHSSFHVYSHSFHLTLSQLFNALCNCNFVHIFSSSYLVSSMWLYKLYNEYKSISYYDHKWIEEIVFKEHNLYINWMRFFHSRLIFRNTKKRKKKSLSGYFKLLYITYIECMCQSQPNKLMIKTYKRVRTEI